MEASVRKEPSIDFFKLVVCKPNESMKNMARRLLSFDTSPIVSPEVIDR